MSPNGAASTTTLMPVFFSNSGRLARRTSSLYPASIDIVMLLPWPQAGPPAAVMATAIATASHPSRSRARPEDSGDDSRGARHVRSFLVRAGRWIVRPGKPRSRRVRTEHSYPDSAGLSRAPRRAAASIQAGRMGSPASPAPSLPPATKPHFPLDRFRDGIGQAVTVSVSGGAQRVARARCPALGQRRAGNHFLFNDPTSGGLPRGPEIRVIECEPGGLPCTLRRRPRPPPPRPISTGSATRSPSSSRTSMPPPPGSSPCSASSTRGAAGPTAPAPVRSG